ncbi:MAG TPA: 50S ribosomal protein L11 methyltransferase [Polyangiaceae bacterium]|nr:50S ribosomal protein L11 methyltransferase [Polyangiaceae bacterium]
MDAPRYWFVALDVPEAESDDVSALLFELGATGVEQRDRTTFVRPDDPDAVMLVASFEGKPEAEAALGELDASYNPRLQELVGDAWRDAWKAHYRPFALTPRLVIRPPWEAAPPPAEGVHVLELEPGRAFGTGLHATTSLVAKELDRREAELAGRPLLDVGTGSGILSFCALTLGASRAVGLDIDADSIAIARENAARNGLEGRVDFSTRDVAALAGAFPVVVANIETHVLVPLAAALRARLAPGGLLVLSGVLTRQEDEIVAAYAGLAVESLTREGEWSCLALRDPGPPRG